MWSVILCGADSNTGKLDMTDSMGPGKIGLSYAKSVMYM